MGTIERENSRAEEIDVFSEYLKSLGNPSVYTREEEQKIFHQYNSGLVMVKATISSESFQKNPILSLPTLQASIDSTKEAYDSIVLHNQGLVISIAKHCTVQLPPLDKIQNGNFGLFRAIDKFDPSLGNKFSTYATPWIKVMMINFSREQSVNIRIPINLINEFIKLKKFQTSFLQMHGHWPTAVECKCQLKWNQRKLDRVTHAGTINRKIVDLDLPLSDEVDSDSFGDTVSDLKLDASHSIEHHLYGEEYDDQREILNRALDGISKSLESGPKFVPAYIESVSCPEISIETLANKYSCSTGELLENLSIVHIKLREAIGIPKTKFVDLQKRHQIQLNRLPKEYQLKKPEINFALLDTVRSSMRNGSRKMAIYIEYNCDKNTTLQGIGLRYGVTRERIRQIVAEVDYALQLQTKTE